MKVLFLMIAYPDVAIDKNLYSDLTHEFIKHGHEVYVAAPGLYSTILNVEGGINVLRIKTLPLFKTSIIKKGIANLLLPYQYTYAIHKHLSNITLDLIITATPPITFNETLRILKKKNKSKIYLILRDIFPQNARDLGLIKNNFVFNYFRRKEKKLYELADSIGCMSKKNIDYVQSHNPEIKTEKLHILSNWINVPNHIDQDENIKDKYDFKDKFVAIFGGNFGVPQKIEFLIQVAERLKGNNEIRFLLVGGGTELNKIKKMVLDRDLQNVRIIDNLPRNEYLKLLNECDIGLVNLSDKFTIPNIPSRTLSYWSLKIPILAAIDRNTDYGDLLDSCKGGLWSITGDADTYISNLLSFYNNPEMRKQMGENGYNYLTKELNSEVAYKTIISSLS
jgi:glycosyltransferase involved in cell wall biosynthesis